MHAYIYIIIFMTDLVDEYTLSGIRLTYINRTPTL